MQFSYLRKELTSTVQLASPLVAALLAQMTMELVNTLMLGQLSPQALAAGSLGLAVFMMLLILCTGLFSAVGVLIARSFGSGHHADIRNILDLALYLASFLAIPFI